MGFYGLVGRGDINKEEDIVSINNRLKKHCKENEFFFSFSIDDRNSLQTSDSCYEKKILKMMT